MSGYADGTSFSPITTQAEITVNCRGDYGEIAQRKANVSRDNTRLDSYPDDNSGDNQSIYPHELIYAWVNARKRNTIMGHTSQAAFSSLNGVRWGATSTNEELTLRIRCVGCAKTPFIFNSKDQLQSGFSAIASGSCTTTNTGDEETHPGDILCFYVVPRPSVPGGPMPGGQFGDTGPGSRQGNPRLGTPRGKLRLGIRPCRFNDMRPGINAALAGVRKPRALQGFADRPLDDLFGDSRAANFQKPTPAEEHGMALFATMAATTCAGVRLLVEKGLLSWGAATSELDLAKRIGFLSTDQNKRALFYEMIDNWFFDYSANKDTSRVYHERLRQEIPGGFDSRSRKVVRAQTDESRYCQIRSNLANYQELGWTRAYHYVQRTQIGTSLSNSQLGKQQDLMLGIGISA